MQALPLTELQSRYDGPYRAYRDEGWVADWRRGYVEQVDRVRDADWETWRDPAFQQLLWDAPAVSGIGPGQSVTVVGAYSDEALAQTLFDARGRLAGLDVTNRAARLQALYDQVLARVYPRYTPRRPRARIVRLLAAIFPDDMTCLMDNGRIWGVGRTLGAPRMPGDFVAQHPALRAKMIAVAGLPENTEETVDQSIFAWFLWSTEVYKPDEGAVAAEPAAREPNAVPPFSLLPANAQRRGLPSVRDNIPLLVAMVREAEQGISREDLIGVILTEATQLNASSAGNMISQAMGGLGLIRLDGAAYRPTERGQELLTGDDPARVLRAPLVGRVFGMGHLLLMVRREPGKLRPSDVSERLRDLVPTWTSAVPGSYILAWAKLVGLVALDDAPGGGRLVLTDDGEDYAAALPPDFEARWRIAEQEEPVTATGPAAAAISAHSPKDYGVADIVADGCFLPPAEIEAAVALLRRKRNLVLQGPPGTGKTWLAKRLGYALMGARDAERLTAVQFQPSLSYEDFVRGWRPDGAGRLTLADGVFLEVVDAARADPGRAYVLVVEEINRGNPAQILGELLTLIEDGKRHPDEALRLAYPRTIGERVYVPANLFIIGTMNLADRSLALVDLALRRRFAFVTLAPALNAAWRAWLLRLGAPAELVDDVAARLGALNDAIAADRALGDQYRVGHSFVTPTCPPGPLGEDWRRWYRETIETEIAPLLAEYWYDKPDEAAKQAAGLLLDF